MSESFTAPKELIPRSWDWGKAWSWLRKYNKLSPLEMEQFIRKQLGSCGEGVTIRAGFLCEKGDRIHIGNNVGINYGCKFMDVGNIWIGNNVAIGPGVTILTADHVAGMIIVKPVFIGDDVVIGANATILMGVKIGDGATVGACSLVTRDVPPNTLVKGVPAK